MTPCLPVFQRYLWVLLGIVGSCRPVESAKVSVIEGPVADRTLSWKAVEQGTIGSPGISGQGWFTGLRRGLVVADLSGGLLVLDAVSSKVVSLHPDGSLRRSFGARGRGPGEFMSPVGIAGADNGTLYVYDLAKRALITFGSDGVPGRELGIEGVYAGGQIAVDEHAVTLARASVDTKMGSLITSLVAIDSGRSRVFVSVEHPLPKGLQIPGCPVPLPVRQRFLPRLIWGGKDGRVAAASGAGYRIDVWDNGVEVALVYRRLPPLLASRDSALRDLEADPLFSGIATGCRANAEHVLDKVGYAKELQVVGSIAFTDAGEMWVRRWSGTDWRTDVFGTDGTYIGTWDTSLPEILTFMGDTSFASIVESDSGQRIAIYAIRR